MTSFTKDSEIINTKGVPLTYTQTAAPSRAYLYTPLVELAGVVEGRAPRDLVAEPLFGRHSDSTNHLVSFHISAIKIPPPPRDQYCILCEDCIKRN